MSESRRIPTRIARDSDAIPTRRRAGFLRDASRALAPAPAARPDPSSDLRPSTATQEVALERAGAIPVSAEPGNRRLRAYLAAEPKVRERFDREQARRILADCDSDHRIANELSGDPVYERVQARRRFEAWLIEQDDQ